MARVVQRSGPPYLAILFVFLFFIAAILAGWFYTQSRNSAEQSAQASSDLKSLANNSEINDQTMNRHKARASANGKTAIGQYRDDQAAFIKAIAGSEVATEEAMTILAQLNELTQGEGLFAFARDTASLMQTKDMQLAAAQKTLLDLEAKTQADAQAAAQAAGELEQKLNAAKESEAQAQAKLKAISDSYTKGIADSNAQWSKRAEDLQKQLAAREDEIRALEQSKREMESEIRRLSNPEGQEVLTDATMGADGNIVKVTDSKDVVYIDIGSNQNVRIGLPFTVYSQRTGVIPDSNGKARIIVKNVHDIVAECQVLRSDAADPIAVGDPIANVAYSIHSHPVFVVGGDFDLDGNGRPDRNGNDAIKSMIRRFGGIVIKDITVDVDYVVMGSEPTKLPRPGADAPPSETELWNQNEAAIAYYKQMLQKSIDYNKPVLNTGRFLTFIGYTPEVVR